MKFLVATTLAMAIVMPAVACDEDVTITSDDGANATVRLKAVGPGRYAAVSAGALGMPDGETNAVITIMDSDDDRRIEIKVENDVVTAKINGEEIPEDRIIRTNEKIVIVDENGDEIYSTNLRFTDDGQMFSRLTFQGNDPFDAYGNWLQAVDVDVEMPNVMLGVHMDAPSPALRKHLRLKEDTATLILGVYEGLPAHNAGLEEYDVIVSVADAEDASPETIRKLLRELEPGDVLEMNVIRAGERTSVSVTLEEYDNARMGAATLLGTASLNPWYVDPGNRITANSPFIYTPRGGSGAIVINPDGLRLDELRAGSLATAEKLRQQALEQMGRLQIDEDSLHQQIDDLRSRLDEVTEMLHKMLEDAAEAKDKALGENET